MTDETNNPLNENGPSTMHILYKYGLTFDTSEYGMMQCTGCIYLGYS